MKKSSANQSKTHKFMPLSASLIASLLFTMNPEYEVVAETTDDSDHLLEIKTLHEEYHSLLNNEEPVAKEPTEESEGLEVAVEIEETEESKLVSDSDEINGVKNLLLHAIEKAGSTEYANQLQASDLTVEELDQIFEALIVENLENAEAEETPVAVEAEEVEESTEEVAEEPVETEEAVEEFTEELETSEEAVEETEAIQEDEEESTEEVTEEAVETQEPVEEVTEELETLEEAVEAEESEAIQEVEEATAEVQEEVEESETLEVIEEIEEPVEVEEVTPAPVAQTMSLRTASAPAATKKAETYTVKAGDNLNKIGRQFGVTADHIASLNNLPNKNRIHVGQVLLINGTKKDLNNLNQNVSSSDFINILGSQAQKVAQEKNLYASVMVAQAALESAFGKSGLSSAPNHNLFGMKGSYEGESVVMTTKEYSNSTGWITINDYFKKYPSYLESLLDHAGYIRRGPSWAPNYYEGVWRENTSSYHDATQSLQGRYATDPTYANKLNKIISEYGLTRFDVIVDSENDEVVVVPPANNDFKDDVTPSTGSEPTPAPTPTPTGSTYSVQSGDTLSHIGRTYNMTVSELQRLNKLSSDRIYVGQTLQVKEQVSTPAPKPSTPAPTGSTYTVQSGDTLSHIGRTYNMTVSALKSLNNLTSDTIYVGQTLEVKEQPSTPAPTPSSPSTSNGSTYTVQSGDTLSHIGRTYNMTVSALKSLNKLTSDTIYVGQTLEVKEQVSTPAPTPTPSSTANGSTYTVQSGDTLSHIGRTYNMTVSALKSLNKLTSDTIYVGQTLEVKEQASTPAPTPSSPSTSNGSTYTVQSGDTLSHIGRTYNMTVSALKSLNKLTSDTIYVGQKLEVKGQASTPAPTPTSSSTSNGSTYTVQSGDTLSHIGRTYNMTVSALKSLNELTSDTIYVGQTLEVEEQASTPAPTPSTSNGSTYTVQSGDTLSHISRTYNMTVSELKRLNNLSSDLIRVGQSLTIEGNSKTVTPSSSQLSANNQVSNTGTIHTVKAGDTLFSIAGQHKVTVANLVAWNNLPNSDLIRVNQELTVKKSTNTADNPTNNKVSNAGTHRIVRGDTLSGIARKFDTTVRSLKEKNNLRTDLIFVGQTLNI